MVGTGDQGFPGGLIDLLQYCSTVSLCLYAFVRVRLTGRSEREELICKLVERHNILVDLYQTCRSIRYCGEKAYMLVQQRQLVPKLFIDIQQVVHLSVCQIGNLSDNVSNNDPFR